jgi:hypothetical protein
MAFEPGNKLAPGGARPGAGRKPDDFKKLFDAAARKAVTPAKMTALVESTLEQALGGNVKAQALLYDRLLGRVENQVRVSGDPTAPLRVVVTFDDGALVGEE